MLGSKLDIVRIAFGSLIGWSCHRLITAPWRPLLPCTYYSEAQNVIAVDYRIDTQRLLNAKEFLRLCGRASITYTALIGLRHR
jgi:hypothetical protein